MPKKRKQKKKRTTPAATAAEKTREVPEDDVPEEYRDKD